MRLWEDTSGGDFGRRLREETLERDFDRRLWEEASGGDFKPRDFGMRLWDETLGGDFARKL